MSTLSDPTLREAAGLGAIAEQAVAAPPLLDPPKFTYEFESFVDPALDGTVVMRYATVGDSLRIESMMGPRSGDFAEAVASISVLVEVAPPAWYRKEPGLKIPTLDLERLIDPEAIVDLYREYNRWRSLFRVERARAKANRKGKPDLEGVESSGA